jgi:hypothetical protein
MFRFLFVGITALGVAMQSRAISTAPVAKSFAFRIALSSHPGATSELWDATAMFAPLSSRPAHFRVRLATPRHSELKTGAVVNGAFLAGESSNTAMSWYALFDAFPPSGSGGMSPVSSDSVSFSAAVRQSDAHSSEWVAELQLQNGAHVLLSLDTKAGRGELRPLGEEHNLRVLSAFMGLGVARQR